MDFEACVDAHPDIEYKLRFRKDFYLGKTDELGLSENIGDNFKIADQHVTECNQSLQVDELLTDYRARNPVSPEAIAIAVADFNTCIEEGPEEYSDAANGSRASDIDSLEQLVESSDYLLAECQDIAFFGPM